MAEPTQLGRHIEFINERERELFAESMLGEEATNFVNSTTGQYLHGRAKAIFNKCVDEMFEIDPYTPEGKKAHAKLKQEAWCAEHFIKWCVDVIQNGNEAATQLSTYRD